MLSKQYCLSLVIVNTVKNVIVNKDILWKKNYRKQLVQRVI